jgi:hypothetical protein
MCCQLTVGFYAGTERMAMRPRGLSTQFGPKETALMRRFAPYAALIASIVSALIAADSVTYWP